LLLRAFSIPAANWSFSEDFRGVGNGLARFRNCRFLQRRVPIGKLAAIVTAKWFLTLAVAGIRWATNSQEIVVMVPPRPGGRWPHQS